MAKVDFCCQKSKFVLFSHEILCCKTFQMTYYLFIYDVPNRSYVILKYSNVENYIWRTTQSKFGKYASLATHTYRNASMQDRWIFGAYDVSDRISYITFVTKRNAATLLPIIAQGCDSRISYSF